MKNKLFITISLYFIVFFLACNPILKNPAEKIRQDSIVKADSINRLFSDDVLKLCMPKIEYKLTLMVKTILADNKDLYIMLDEIPTSNSFVEIYNSDDRNTKIIFIYIWKSANPPMRLIVNQTEHNITENGYVTTYYCNEPENNNIAITFRKFQNKKEAIYFHLLFDYNNERNQFMQNLMLFTF